jgi:hypothetical protein
MPTGDSVHGAFSPRTRQGRSTTRALASASRLTAPLAGQLPARAPPALTPQARAIARTSGALPPPLHITQVRLTSLTGARDSWAANHANIHTRGRQTTAAQLSLSPAGGGWKAAELIPPNADTLIAPNPPALPLASRPRPAAPRERTKGIAPRPVRTRFEPAKAVTRRRVASLLLG